MKRYRHSKKAQCSGSTQGRRRSNVVAFAFIAAVCALATACGGSVVAPEDFLGNPQAGAYYGGPGTDPGTGTGSGQLGPGNSPGSGVPVPSGSGSTQAPVSGSGNTDGNAGAGGTGGGNGGGGAGPTAGVKVGDCGGFKNGPGMTDSTITIATIADRSGAVADTFKSAHDAMNAYVAYFNATSSICGRKLKLQTYDSGLTAVGSNDASKSACTSAFALVGSFSAFDSGGANVTASCGQPDLRAAAVERERQRARTTVQVAPLDTDHIFLQPWVWAKQKFGDATKKAAFVYLNVGASTTISNAIIKGTTAKLGYDWQKTIVVDITGVPNWNAYANQLKAAGIKLVQTNLAENTVKLRAAFKQAGFNPTFLADGSVYGPKFLNGNDAQYLEGAYSFTNTALLEETARTPELQLMQTWLGRTGGDAGNVTAMEAWAAGRLFTKTALELGGKLNRESLLSALRKVHRFDGNGILTPMDPGSGTTSNCSTVVQVSGGKFVRVTPYPYTCGPLA